ncbi:hypothetical protein [Mycobacterium paragordonae]|uniref:Uncharacterized protein n=1 Tax=Mycobacterium paragordonae TaxID=1389713 RepID=A0AAJ1RXK4_9MYCO|nr:hypothetical protein [Mycobacterium paragordonae]MDP7733661.1 hypothetical protein [Mycobacterium paragordonae]
MRAEEPCILFAETIHLAGLTGLLVYRSTWLRDTDRLYEVVADLVCRSTAVQVIVKETIEDPEMIFGQAEVMFALLHSSPQPIDPTDPSVCALIDLAASFAGNVSHPLKVVDDLISRLDLNRIER